MTRRNIIIGIVVLALLWAVVFIVTSTILNSIDEEVVDFETLPTPTQRPTRTDVPELLAPTATVTPTPDLSNATLIAIASLPATATATVEQRPSPAFTLSPLEIERFSGVGDSSPFDLSVVQPTLDISREEAGGAYPIRLAIPELGLLAPVLQVQTDPNFDIVTPRNEIGHYALSPRLGEGGNTVMVGHVYPGRVFNKLLDAQVGQIVRITDEYYTEHYYRIESIIRFPYEIGKPEDREIGFQYMYDNSQERITLVTCYPEYEWTHRFVVRAVPIAPPETGN